MNEYAVDVYTKDDKALYWGRVTYPVIQDDGSLFFKDLSRNEEVLIPQRNLSYLIIHLSNGIAVSRIVKEVAGRV